MASSEVVVHMLVVVVVLLSLLSFVLPWMGNCSIHKCRDNDDDDVQNNHHHHHHQDHTTSTTASLSGSGTGSALLFPLRSLGFYSSKDNKPVPPSGPSKCHNKMLINSRGP
ncbi:hypothetical protein HYC85_000160 [Camellia sinensis]|uniref:Uncharacterized protein n=1 Tax=Camellia sinensis TaxID=4442 RepID=A0A7J7I315_CAMSI|nr:hypothetical protein HYC85_000160 [Camellia sinensis]